MTDSTHVMFQCPRCQKPLRIAAQLIGKHIRCPDSTCGQVSLVAAPHPEEAAATLDRPRKKRRKRSLEEAPRANKRHKAAYRLLSRALLLHLPATGLFYVSLLLLGISLMVSVWQDYGNIVLPELSADKTIKIEKVMEQRDGVFRQIAIVKRSGSPSWEICWLNESDGVIKRRLVPAGTPLGNLEDLEDLPANYLYLEGLVWAALVLVLVATLLDLGLLVVPDLHARLLLLLALPLRAVPAVLVLTLFKADHAVLAVIFLGIVLFGCVLSWLMFFTRLADLRNAAGVRMEATELIKVGGFAVIISTHVVFFSLFPLRLFTVTGIWGTMCSAAAKMGLTESLLGAIALPTGIPFLLRYLNMTLGVRGSLP